MRWKKYISFLVTIIVLRFLDLYITFRYTPDLAYEWNPLVSLFGVAWQGLIVTQLLIISFVAILMYFYFNRQRQIRVTTSGLSLNDFIYIYFFGKLVPWPKRIFSMPKNPLVHLEFNGFILMCATILISTFAIIHNVLLILHIEAYIVFVARYYQAYFPVFFAVVLLLSTQAFFTLEYRKYQRSMS